MPMYNVHVVVTDASGARLHDRTVRCYVSAHAPSRKAFFTRAHNQLRRIFPLARTIDVQLTTGE